MKPISAKQNLTPKLSKTQQHLNEENTDISEFFTYIPKYSVTNKNRDDEKNFHTSHTKKTVLYLMQDTYTQATAHFFFITKETSLVL